MLIHGKKGDGSDSSNANVHDGGLSTFASATSSGAATPSDATVFDFNALYVGGTGNIVIKHTTGGAAVTYPAVPAGTVLPVSGVRVMAATTAAFIVWMKW
jgi:hypothetical protein